MKACLITFRSVTPAQRGESLLRNAGYGCSVQRTPRWMEEKGCGYSLRVNAQDVSDCIRMLRERRIAFRKVYCPGENGSMEELML